MDDLLNRRHMLAGATGLAASFALPSWASAAPAGPLSPEQGLDSYRRILCGAKGEEVLWWFIGDLYYHTRGKSVVPYGRSLTIGSYTAKESTSRSFKYGFREAGVMIDIDTGERLMKHPITGAPVDVPLVDEQPHDIDWVVQDDGSILRTQHEKSSTLNLRWTQTSSNLLLLETQPGKSAFGVAPGDSGVDWKDAQSTRTVYAKRADLKRKGFVPAKMIFNVSLKMNPPWLADGGPGDHWLIVHGIGEKSRAKDIVNRDALEMVRRYFPKYI